ncbi:caspase domain-containing protein [Mycena crocata]|nr:caspase domain-containing protein [Mycena crocata]
MQTPSIVVELWPGSVTDYGEFRDLRCPFFAFIIGIDEYLSYDIPDLRGCVNDAQTIRAFLINRFHIPEAQIVFLTNEQATREAILEKFQSHLIYNPSIEKDDTIIVYYAGHGSRAGAPDSWPSIDGKIETLVPHDERGKTARGDVIHGIPDRTINTLLSTLATAKGNNIVRPFYRPPEMNQTNILQTVILDCCHSGGITRGSRPFVLPGARFVETLVPIPENLDQALLWGARAGDVSLPVGISYEFMHSHVLLAACRQQQRARECISTRGVPGGFFTESLIKQLRSIGPNRITYSELMELLPTLPDQIPQCEGVNKDRFIFDIEGPRHNPMSCAFSKKESGVMEVKIGSIHGVVVGTQFVTERDARIGGEPSTTFIAVSVSTESSILTPVPAVSVEDLPLSEGTRLVVSHWNNDAMMMKVYLQSSDDPQLEISDVSTPRTGSSFLLEQSLENADLAVRRVSDEEFSLTRLDTKIPPYAGQDVKLNIPLENLPYALDAVAHFNYFLGRHNGSDPFGDEVQLEMYNLLGDYPSRMPNPDVGNLVVKNEACFALGKDERYGFAICNYSQRDLFPYLFYFDPGTYSIDVRPLEPCFDVLLTATYYYRHGICRNPAPWPRRCPLCLGPSPRGLRSGMARAAAMRSSS